jgi:uncharacterized membrane protein YeaQ/YmgE (transglycosylase-associated protein family)
MPPDQKQIPSNGQGHMSQTTRALGGFFVAPAFPGALVYLYNFFWKGYGDAAVVGPFILVLFGYAAALVLGVPAHLILHRKGIHSPFVYGLLGALIGPVFFVTFEVLTAYPGTLWITLQYSYGAAFVAAAYSSLAAIAFWAIAYWPRTKHLAAK